MIERTMYLLINLAYDDDAVTVTGKSEPDLIALPCRDLDDLAQQIALKDFARSHWRRRPMN